ncbi:cobalt-precorrin 5A hydrolase [Marinomonas posidonica]|uniref:Cobalamin (Vitamin B12) biosynthesis CbiG protein n=1 Tax=Marinomonas posidonica (strain CECT 7376 / NCIMB 14433 / IVIA-Po-181) TaxID=491952 RepID=F6CSU3_MARPP|nr:cobalamin biosynthesis protein [Marinomonas posidonica]AEF53933.1 cobalamin (vitamin B12) biosynthesis CbiG protein [Marinomonas posidonica IVIA-Po-181]
MIRIFALTPTGRTLAERLCGLYPEAQFEYKPKPFADKVQQAFIQQDQLLFICATGIVMRTLAPVLQDKHQDPPVLVLDEAGQFVIPLLSGHEGGANNWAAQVAEMLGAQLVMTTAKPYVNPTYTLGMGCERHCPLSYLESLMLETLQQQGLTPQDIHSLNSIDVKADETQLIALAEKYQWPFQTYSAEQLMPMEPLLSTRSEYVFNTVGVYGVAESAALLAAQKATDSEPELVVNKIKNAKATCALSRGFGQTK